MRTLTFLCATVAMSVAAISRGQTPTDEPRSGLVLDAVVVDAAGQPVADLSAADFVVTVNGVARPPRSARFVSQPSGVPGAEGRMIVLVIDQASLRAGSGHPAITAAAAFLDRLAPSDRVGLVTLPGGGPAVDVTTDRAAIKTALGRVAGHVRPAPNTMSHTFGLVEALYFFERDPRWNLVVTRECAERYLPGYLVGHCETGIEQDAENMVLYVKEAAASTVNVLQRVLLWSAFVEGPKSIVLLSEGLVSGSPQRPNSLVDTEPLRKAAALAGASLYLLHLRVGMPDMRRSPTAQEDEDLRRTGFDVVAAKTGGLVLAITSGAEAAFSRVAREMSGYYVLGVDPTGVNPPSDPVTLKVEVERAGAVVRAHSGRLRAAGTGTR